MLQGSPLPISRGLTGFKLRATPGKIRVIRHSPVQKSTGADRAAEKDEYENARLLQVIHLLGRWLELSDKQGIIRNVLLTEKYRLIRHGGKWHKEPIFEEKFKEIGALSPLDERWDHGMLIGDFFASEVSWLREDLIEKQHRWRSKKQIPLTPQIWDGDWFLGVPSPLDRPDEFPTKPERKKAGFTAKARETLENAGVVAEIEWGRNAVLVTCTLPATGFEAYKLLADSSGKIMSRLWDRLSVHCKRKLNRPARLGWFYVWEKQKRGALHLHACLAACPQDFTGEELLSLGEKVTQWWFEILRDIGDENQVNMFLNTETGIDWSDSPQNWQSDVQLIKKSIARYLSKYASKNAATERGATFDGDSDGYPTPSRWWGKNQVISRLIRKWSWDLSLDCANPLDVPLNEIVHDSLRLYPGNCHTDRHTECHTNTPDCHTGCHTPSPGCHTDCMTGVDKSRTDFWELVKDGRTICNGITSTYLYSPQNYTEAFSQVVEMASVISSLVESASERMIPWDVRLPPEPFIFRRYDTNDISLALSYR